MVQVVLKSETLSFMLYIITVVCLVVFMFTDCYNPVLVKRYEKTRDQRKKGK